MLFGNKLKSALKIKFPLCYFAFKHKTQLFLSSLVQKEQLPQLIS